MKAGHIYRDVAFPEQQTSHAAQAGRACVAVIGIDRYRTWNRLYNAVNDARGALRLFTGLGFELVAPPLFDETATGDALRRLVVDDLSGLGENDSLVLFFAGHGHTITRRYGGTSVKDGYLIPVDGDRPGHRAGTWIRLESWLTEISRIPAKHILVILDACHSGVALGPILQWRSRGMETAPREPLEQLRARRSRRIITSALDDQLAMDGGPVPGHSLFTGCLIEAMTGGLAATTGHQIVTGSEIGYYMQRRVCEYPGSRQTPDFGALELDDRGELLVHIREHGEDKPQAVAVDEANAGAPPGNQMWAPGAEQLLTPVAAAAPESPNAGGLSPSTGRHASLLRIGAGVVMAIAGGIVATLMAAHTSTSVDGVRPALGRPSDAEGAAITPPDATLAAAPLDAGQHETTANTLPGEADDAVSKDADRAPIYDRGN